MTFVLDNSVAMRWCFESAAHPYADGILNRLAAGEGAVVPVLWFYEASAVLSREQNRGILAAPKAEDFIAELQALRRKQVVPLSSSPPRKRGPRENGRAAARILELRKGDILPEGETIKNLINHGRA